MWLVKLIKKAIKLIVIKKILITGTAGFIGYHLCKSLLEQGHEIFGLDNINDYYDTKLKRDRLEILLKYEGFHFYLADIANYNEIMQAVGEQHIDVVVNLAAQAGVRYSLTNPDIYIKSNINGFYNILEYCRQKDINKLVYASSSSVYGGNTEIPFEVNHAVNKPLSLYAASKASNELMAYSYSHLFGIETIGLRFFTVYGPWGRPDMALFLFTKSIIEDVPIDVYNHGKMARDFTYVDDIIRGINSTIENQVRENDLYKIYNIGSNQPVELMDFIHEIETQLNKKAKIRFLPMQPGDVPSSHADIKSLMMDYNFKPNTPISYGIRKFVEWYKNYYNK